MSLCVKFEFYILLRVIMNTNTNNTVNMATQVPKRFKNIYTEDEQNTINAARQARPDIPHCFIGFNNANKLMQSWFNVRSFKYVELCRECYHDITKKTEHTCVQNTEEDNTDIEEKLAEPIYIDEQSAGQLSEEHSVKNRRGRPQKQKPTNEEKKIQIDIFDNFVKKYANFKRPELTRFYPILKTIIRACLIFPITNDDSSEKRQKELISKFIILSNQTKNIDIDKITNRIIKKYQDDNSDINSNRSIYDRLGNDISSDYSFGPNQRVFDEMNIHTRVSVIKNALLILNSATNNISMGVIEHNDDIDSMYHRIMNNEEYNGIYRISLKLNNFKVIDKSDDDILFEFVYYEKIGMVKSIDSTIDDRFEKHKKTMRPSVENIYTIQKDPDKKKKWIDKLKMKKEQLKTTKKHVLKADIENCIDEIEKDCILPTKFCMRKIYPTTDATTAEQYIHANIHNAAKKRSHVMHFEKGCNKVIGMNTSNPDSDISSDLFIKSSETVKKTCLISLSDIVKDTQSRVELVTTFNDRQIRDFIEDVAYTNNFDLFDYVYSYIDNHFSSINLFCLYNSLRCNQELSTIKTDITQGVNSLRTKQAKQISNLQQKERIEHLKAKNKVIELERNIEDLENKLNTANYEKNEQMLIAIKHINILNRLKNEGHVDLKLVDDLIENYNEDDYPDSDDDSDEEDN